MAGRKLQKGIPTYQVILVWCPNHQASNKVRGFHKQIGVPSKTNAAHTLHALKEQEHAQSTKRLSKWDLDLT
eukprot:249170-Pelagomonas_calceolata.AAC.10